MQIDSFITNFKQKIEQLMKAGKSLPIFNILLQKIPYLKKYLPMIIMILILIIGLSMGKKIASLFSQPVSIPKPAPLPTTILIPTDSNMTPLKQSIIQFSPQLPDPLMPEYNDSITLEPLD
jgi:hypothetical protein